MNNYTSFDILLWICYGLFTGELGTQIIYDLINRNRNPISIIRIAIAYGIIHLFTCSIRGYSNDFNIELTIW